jgi:hypothetical protein
MQHAKLLLVGERHAGAAIVDHVIPGRQQRTLVDLAFGDAACRGRDQLELVDRSLADAVDFAQARDRRVNDSANEPNVLSRVFASGLVSRRGSAGNSAISSSS